MRAFLIYSHDSTACKPQRSETGLLQLDGKDLAFLQITLSGHHKAIEVLQKAHGFVISVSLSRRISAAGGIIFHV